MPNAQSPRSSAAVILLRDSPAGPEVYLLRRHRKARFMSSSFVFPGGMALGEETDLRQTAARELFEEAGVLLSDTEISQKRRTSFRGAANEQDAPLNESAPGLRIATERLHYFAHWTTPSFEPRRYSAQFFVAVLPEGQTASPDNVETVDEVWVTPKEALRQSAELRLPPPQLRTFYELQEPAKGGIAGILQACAERSSAPCCILPRVLQDAPELTLLFPWDPDYQTLGTGEAMPMLPEHPLAFGPSRVIHKDGVWIMQSP